MNNILVEARCHEIDGVVRPHRSVEINRTIIPHLLRIKRRSNP